MGTPPLPYLTLPILICDLPDKIKKLSRARTSYYVVFTQCLIAPWSPSFDWPVGTVAINMINNLSSVEKQLKVVFEA